MTIEKPYENTGSALRKLNKKCTILLFYAIVWRMLTKLGQAMQAKIKHIFVVMIIYKRHVFVPF